MVPQVHKRFTVTAIKTEQSTAESHKLVISGSVRRDVKVLPSTFKSVLDHLDVKASLAVSNVAFRAFRWILCDTHKHTHTKK